RARKATAVIRFFLVTACMTISFVWTADLSAEVAAQVRLLNDLFTIHYLLAGPSHSIANECRPASGSLQTRTPDRCADSSAVLLRLLQRRATTSPRTADCHHRRRASSDAAP